MTAPSRARALLLITALATLLAACGTAANPSEAPSEPAEPSQQPSEAPSQAPSERPSEAPGPSEPGAPVPSGTLTVGDGAVVDGPGAALADALAGDLSNPILVRGALFLDEDGTVWLADSVVDESVPTFGEIRLRVENYPNSGPTWDMADAEITGLQEANGIRFYPDTKLYGTITP
jgi:hypothetical protein